MNFISFSFCVIVYFVITNTKCMEKSHLLYNNTNNNNNMILTGIFNKSRNFPLKFSPGQFKTENVHNSENIKINKNSYDDDDDDNLLSDEEERGKKCLKNITKCLQEDTTYRSTSDKLYQHLTIQLPPFDLSQTVGVSKSCQKDSRKYIEDLQQFKLWALKMYDSSAKFPSGILNGNVNQLGDFDMCLSAKSDDEKITGQYCLASFDIQITRSNYLSGLHKLIQSHYHFKSKLEDPGHRVPKFSSIHWALCIPNSCTVEDIEIGLKSVIKNLFDSTELEVKYQVNSDMCQTRNKKKIPESTYIALIVFGAIICFELFATLYDIFAVGEPNQWITSFSLKQNIQSLITIKRNTNDIEAVHGIRMLNAILLLLAHKSMAIFFLPYVNRTEFVEYLARPFSVIGRAASLYTDPFIMISGLLTSYSLIGKLNRNGKINIIEEYVSRIYRIVPTFVALIAFCTFILPWLYDGPMWNTVVTHHSDICKKYWWRNLLFIHNYFGFKDMCLTHTHHLGIDTQLFFTSPFLIYGLWRWPVKGTVSLVFLASVSTIARYYVTYTMRLSNYVHFGTSIQQLFDTADHMYILPPHRATVYIMGIFLGYLLRKYGSITLSKTQLRIGNMLAVFSFLISYLGPAFMGKIDYVYNPQHAALYAAISPILWVFSFCWIIFTSHFGYTGFIGKLLSLPIWSLWTKISYTVYLTQFPIFFFNVGVTRAAHEFGFFTKMLNLQEYTWVLLLSIVLSVLFEMPSHNIRNLVLRRKIDKAKIA